ncbi:MAG: CRISPR-associated endoribonuclease Cse3 [Candidatus Hydrogenedentes bacterium ADurb.Bin101]|nr:MAG: CRISPR-associated endoribonuclease Cse3 [Candidatus Hydrogenedentes bacterium ADurb.Bin101]
MPIDALYLSRILLNPHSRQVISELDHPYEMHRTLLRAFPEVPAGNPGPRDTFSVLFRAEPGDPSGPVTILVQSTERADWTFLERLPEYLWQERGSAPYDCKDILPSLNRLEPGRVLSFRLRANPTRRVAKQDDPMKGKRVELSREQDQLDWLARKGTGSGDHSGGFELVTKNAQDRNGEAISLPCVRACSERKILGLKKQPGAGHKVTQLSVMFEGLLRVTDPGAFVETLARGIGSGKAFGFGLLSVAPVRASGLGGVP